MTWSSASETISRSYTMEPSDFTFTIFESESGLIGSAFISGGVTSMEYSSKGAVIMKMMSRKKRVSIRFVRLI